MKQNNSLNTITKCLLKKDEMKKLIFLLFLTLMVSNVFAQTETKFKTEVSNVPIKTSTYLNTDVMNEPVMISKIITTIPTNVDIFVNGYLGGGWWLIKKDDIVGYAFSPDLIVNEQMNSLITKWDINIFGEDIYNRILKHEIWLGMSPLMACRSLGTPKNINKSTYEFGIREQWVYENMYLYFENDKLTLWK